MAEQTRARNELAAVLEEMEKPADPAPDARMRRAHGQVRAMSNLLASCANEVLPVISADTCFALGQALGTVDKALALLGRDIDGLRAGPPPAMPPAGDPPR